MATSTGDITQRPQSDPAELIVTTENNTNDGGETNASALINGKSFIQFFF